MRNPLIDVLIPAFNVEATVRGAIQSILNQTLGDFRIVVVDDGSTDRTPFILRELAITDDRIEVFTTPNGGVVEALNFGLAQCRSKYIARHDADDLADPHRFATQIAYLEANPDCVALGGAARHIDETGEATGSISRHGRPEDADLTLAPTREPYIIHPLLMTRLNALRHIGGYRNVIHAQDTDLYWRLQEIGRLHNLDEILGSYRLHNASVSSLSVVNGRVSALYSQLSAISAARRRNGAPDLDFSQAMIDDINLSARGIGDIFAIGARFLNTTEVLFLEIAIAGKLMELASYRPYYLEQADCHFIIQAMRRHRHNLTGKNWGLLQRLKAVTAAQLLKKGALSLGFSMVSLPILPQVVLRLARSLFAVRSFGKADSLCLVQALSNGGSEITCGSSLASPEQTAIP